MRDDQFKEVEIGGQRYQLSKMTPLVASRVHGWLTSSFVKFAREQAQSGAEQEEAKMPDMTPEDRAASMVAFIWMMAAPTQLSEETLTKIQTYCLRSCSGYLNRADASYLNGADVPLALMMADGRLDKSLEQEPVTVAALIVQALQFSIAPFFIEGAAVALPKTKQTAAPATAAA